MWTTFIRWLGRHIRENSDSLGAAVPEGGSANPFRNCAPCHHRRTHLQPVTGAVSYLTKDVDLQTLPQALLEVAEGKAAIPRPLVARMVMPFHSGHRRFRTTEVGAEMGPRLTSRELDVFAGLAEGLSTREIARRVQLPPSAAEKEGCRTRALAPSFLTETGRLAAEGERAVRTSSRPVPGRARSKSLAAGHPPRASLQESEPWDRAEGEGRRCRCR
jgi:hypothetical protein